MTDPTANLEQRLHAFLDGELSASERAEVEQILARDANSRAQLDGLRLLQRAVVAGLQAEADKVPEARFEQIWDEIDRELDRDPRLQKAPTAPLSIWARIGAVLRPRIVPLATAAGVAAVALVTWGALRDGPAPANNEPRVASNPEVHQPVSSDTPVPVVAPADEPMPEFPAPNGGPAQIKRIEWSGKAGRISEIEGKRTTTTVIWISDDDPGSSERSL